MLASIYDVEPDGDVSNFLTTDEALVRRLDRHGRRCREKLLLASDAEHVDLSLYIDSEVLDNLTSQNPFQRLHDDNLEDYWTAIEGVSHFVYVAWNAAFGKRVTLLELELQAEIDKYVTTMFLLYRQRGGHVPPELHRWLFDRPVLCHRLAADERDRYRHANRFAAKFCRQLSARLAHRPRRTRLMRDLRRFYRLPKVGKLRHISALPA